MRKYLHKISLCLLMAVVVLFVVSVPAFAADGAAAASDETSSKAAYAAIVTAVAAASGAIAMGFVIAKSVESIARQPEAEGKIRSALLIGLVFIETAIIYALVVAIMIIFVL